MSKLELALKHLAKVLDSDMCDIMDFYDAEDDALGMLIGELESESYVFERAIEAVQKHLKK